MKRLLRLSSPFCTLMMLASVFTQASAQSSDTTPPNFIEEPKVSDIERTSATISWKTNELATGFVEFGTDSSLAQSIDIAELKEEHEVQLQGLMPGTSYLFRVGAVDSSGNGPTVSAIDQFTTEEPEDANPGIKILTRNVEVEVGDSVQLLAIFVDSSGVEVDTTFDWSVEPDSLGIFNKTGLFTATNAGEGHIFARIDPFADSVRVKVKDEDRGEDGDGGAPGEGEFFILPEDTTVEVGSSIQFTAHFRDTSGAVIDTVAQWSLKGNPIGTISADGLLDVFSPGVALVKAKLDNKEQTTMVTAIDTTVDSSGVNIIKISRVLPDGHVLPPLTIEEGNVYVIGGMPYPLNILNGGHVFFPSGSLDDHITVLVRLPEFAEIRPDTVEFGDGILTGVTFEVFVNDSLISPFFFNKPLNVGLVLKRGLLQELGVNPDNLSLFFAEGGGVFENTGINDVTVDSSSNRIFGQIEHFSTLVVMEKGTTVNVDENSSQIPDAFELLQNYPNPFNPETSIHFRVPQKSHVTLTIYNILGQKIRTLLDEQIEVGHHTLRWNGKDDKGIPVASGLYLYRIETESFSQVRKMTLIR